MRLLEVLPLVPVPPVSSRLADHVVAACPGPRLVAAGWWPLLQASCAVAAVGLLALLPSLIRQGPSMAAVADQARLPAVQSDRADEVRAGPAEAAQFPLVSPVVYRDLVRTLTEQFEDVSADPLESVDSLADGLRPIATSFATAIGALRRSLPLPKHDAHEPPRRPQARRGALDHMVAVSGQVSFGTCSATERSIQECHAERAPLT